MQLQPKPIYPAHPSVISKVLNSILAVKHITMPFMAIFRHLYSFVVDYFVLTIKLSVLMITKLHV